MLPVKDLNNTSSAAWFVCSEAGWTKDAETAFQRQRDALREYLVNFYTKGPRCESRLAETSHKWAEQLGSR